MRKSKLIPDMSIYEASAFWDDHDFAEFDDVEEVKDIKFHLIKKKYVGLDLNIYAKIRKQARKLKTTEDVLINEWLREKAEESCEVAPRNTEP
ncbi:MAG: CopG family antitoxin [Pseudomonadota bacterium]